MLVFFAAFLVGGGLLYVGIERSELSFGIVGAVAVLVSVMAPGYAIYIGGASQLDRIALFITLAALISGAVLTVTSVLDGGTSPVRFYSYLALLGLGVLLIVPAFWVSDHQGLATQFNDQRDMFDDPAKPSTGELGEMSKFAERAGLSLTGRYYRCETEAPVARCPEQDLQVKAEGYRVLRNSLFEDLLPLLGLAMTLLLVLGVSEFRSVDPDDGVVRPSLVLVLGEPLLALAFGVSLMAAIASLSNSQETQADLGELAGSSAATGAVWFVGAGALLYMVSVSFIWRLWPGALIFAAGFLACGFLAAWMLMESRVLWVGLVPAAIAYGLIRWVAQKRTHGRPRPQHRGPSIT